ncbi:MAG TPA: nucleotidyltransferase domain-containing protein [bacterium]|nr:nucleotidyltransferase domain-containing protein [bacterium]
MISERILTDITKRLVARFRPERIILFGSHARGKSDDRGDVDILVACPIKGKRRRLMVETDGALEGLELAIDIIVLTPDEFELDRQMPAQWRGRPGLRGRSYMNALQPHDC